MARPPKKKRSYLVLLISQSIPALLPLNFNHHHVPFKPPDGDSHDGHDHAPQIFEDKILAKLIDPVLKDGDINGDGMIDYAEFISAQIRNQKGEGLTIELSS